MSSIRIRNTVIGEGIPKICIPVLGNSREEILSRAACVQNAGADVAEWRVDWFDRASDFSEVEEVLKDLRTILGDIPLLMTFRTRPEGGEKDIEAKAYEELGLRAIETGYIDIIDVELFSGDDLVDRIISRAHQYGVKVIVSSHDFQKTPSREEIISRLIKMQKLGADLPKIAVMPQNKEDVLTLLSATEEMVRKYADRPIITMSMAGLGVISRLLGEVFGSAMTFGSTGRASAPGQPDAEDLRTILGLLHKIL